MSDTSPGRLEFWFEFASNYSYLSIMRIEAMAARHRVRIVWKPFLLGPIFQAFGMRTSPFVEQKLKGAYVQQDMARQCRKQGLPAWKPPTVFPRLSILPARLALLGAEQPWIGAFCRAVMTLNFVEDRDINTAEAISPILAALGLPAADLLERAQSEESKAALRRQTDEALRRGIFGAPMFFVGNEMFWGNDRLDDALGLACRPLPVASDEQD